METKLSQRLESLAAFVPQGARLADIGSDHAYLPLYLVEKGQIDFAVAGEVVQGPYQSALQNVSQSGQSKTIQVRLANGLAAIEVEDRINTVTIAGMGGRLIRDILESGQSRLAGVERLVLQPNNREPEVRKWLMDHGFRLVAERIVEENQKIYEILVAERGQADLTPSHLQFGPYLLEEKSPVFLAKWSKEREKLQKAYQQIPEEKKLERSVLAQKIDEIEEVLHVS